MRLGLCLLLLAALAAAPSGAQQIRNYTRQELYAGQICGDDGYMWEPLTIGECPQGYNGLRNWAKARGLFGVSPDVAAARAATLASPNGTWTAQARWPWCNPCKDGQLCFEFKPGVAKCVVAAEAAPAPAAGSKAATVVKQFLPEGATCLDFSGGKKKWAPKEVNPVLYGKSCEWPQFSCNWDAKANNGTYTCQRIRNAAGAPVVKCYRAAGGRWWGGSDQWYALVDNKFMPCGGPNTDYKSCTAYPGCAGLAPWAWAE